MGTIFTVSLYCSEEQMQFPAELRLSEHMGPIVTVPLHCCEEEMQFHKAQHNEFVVYTNPPHECTHYNGEIPVVKHKHFCAHLSDHIWD